MLRPRQTPTSGFTPGRRGTANNLLQETEEGTINDAEQFGKLSPRETQVATPASYASQVGSRLKHAAAAQDTDSDSESDVANQSPDGLEDLDYDFDPQLSEFLNIRSADFKKLEELVTEFNPDLIRSSHNAWFNRYRQVVRRDDSRLSRRIVERFVILRETQKIASTSYLHALVSNDKSALKEHYRRVDQLCEALKLSVPSHLISEDLGSVPGGRSFRSVPSSETNSGETDSSSAPATRVDEWPELSKDYRIFTGSTAINNVFAVGSVFAVLWHENVGAPALSSRSSKFADWTQNPQSQFRRNLSSSQGPMGQSIYSHIRRFIVIRQRKSFSLCVPISTYGGRGLRAKKFSMEEQRAHAIIYNNSEHPRTLQDEPRCWKEPIAADLFKGETLSIVSRIHFGKIYTVEHNVKIRPVGKVIPDHVKRLVYYAQEEAFGPS